MRAAITPCLRSSLGFCAAFWSWGILSFCLVRLTRWPMRRQHHMQRFVYNRFFSICRRRHCHIPKSLQLSGARLGRGESVGWMGPRHGLWLQRRLGRRVHGLVAIPALHARVRLQLGFVLHPTYSGGHGPHRPGHSQGGNRKRMGPGPLQRMHLFPIPARLQGGTEGVLCCPASARFPHAGISFAS